MNARFDNAAYRIVCAVCVGENKPEWEQAGGDEDFFAGMEPRF